MFNCNYYGVVGILGLPNAGKSTLFNNMINIDFSVITNKPGTTRSEIIGVRNLDNFNIIFIDTPGFNFKNIKYFNNLDKVVKNAIHLLDVIIFVIDIADYNFINIKLLQFIKFSGIKNIFLIINKIDKIQNKNILSNISIKLFNICNFIKIFNISAFDKVFCDSLIFHILNCFKYQKNIFFNKFIINKNLRFIIYEIIRKYMILNFNKEVPFVSDIKLLKFIKNNKIIFISFIIIIIKFNIKKILIGKKGLKLKLISSYIRKELELIFKLKVNIDIWIKYGRYIK